MRPEELERELRAIARSSTDPFVPLTRHDPHGDCIEVLLSDESFKVQWVDEFFTMYHGRESGVVIGGVIKGISRLLEAIIEIAPGFRHDIIGNRVRVDQLLSARLWTLNSADDVRVRQYKAFRDEVQNVESEFEMIPR